jgi:hypothetical protein
MSNIEMENEDYYSRISLHLGADLKVKQDENASLLEKITGLNAEIDELKQTVEA